MQSYIHNVPCSTTHISLLCARAAGAVGDMPNTMQNLLSREVAMALKGGGDLQLQAEAVRMAAKLCREAAAMAAVHTTSGLSMLPLGLLAKRRPDFWHAAQQPPQVGRVLAL